MNFKKFISGVSAFAIAASAFAGMAVTANAATTILSENFDGTTNIFNAVGSNVTAILGSNALRPSNTAVSADFDVDTETEGNQAIQVGTGKAVTVEYDAYHGYLGGNKTGTVTLFNSDNAPIASYTYALGTCKISDVKVGGTTVSGFAALDFASKYSATQNANGIGGNGKPYLSTAGYNPHIAITVTDGGVVSFNFVRGYGNVDVTYSASLASGTKLDIAKMTVESYGNNADREMAIDNLVISEDASSASGSYVIKYVCDNQEIQDSISSVAEAGTTPTINTNNIVVNGKTYIYLSNDAETVGAVVQGDTVTYTITYREAVPYTSTVTAKSGNDTLNVYSATAVDTSMGVCVYYNKYINYGGKYYVTNAKNTEPWYGVNYTAVGNTDVEYTEADVLFASEIEDLTTEYVASGAQNGRYSNGVTRRIGSNKSVKVWTATDEKKVTVTLWARNQSSSQKSSIHVYLEDAEGNRGAEPVATLGEWGTGAQGEMTTDEFTVPAGNKIVIFNDTAYNSNLEMDYVVVKEVEQGTPAAEPYDKGYTFTTSNDVASKKYTKLTIKVNDTADNNKPGYATIDIKDQIATISGPAALTILIKNIPAAYEVTSVELN